MVLVHVNMSDDNVRKLAEFLGIDEAELCDFSDNTENSLSDTSCKQRSEGKQMLSYSNSAHPRDDDNFTGAAMSASVIELPKDNEKGGSKHNAPGPDKVAGELKEGEQPIDKDSEHDESGTKTIDPSSSKQNSEDVVNNKNKISNNDHNNNESDPFGIADLDVSDLSLTDTDTSVPFEPGHNEKQTDWRDCEEESKSEPELNEQLSSTKIDKDDNKDDGHHDIRQESDIFMSESNEGKQAVVKNTGSHDSDKHIVVGLLSGENVSGGTIKKNSDLFGEDDLPDFSLSENESSNELKNNGQYKSQAADIFCNPVPKRDGMENVSKENPETKLSGSRQSEKFSLSDKESKCFEACKEKQSNHSYTTQALEALDEKVLAPKNEQKDDMEAEKGTLKKKLSKINVNQDEDIWIGFSCTSSDKSEDSSRSDATKSVLKIDSSKENSEMGYMEENKTKNNRKGSVTDEMNTTKSESGSESDFDVSKKPPYDGNRQKTFEKKADEEREKEAYKKCTIRKDLTSQTEAMEETFQAHNCTYERCKLESLNALSKTKYMLAGGKCWSTEVKKTSDENFEEADHDELLTSKETGNKNIDKNLEATSVEQCSMKNISKEGRSVRGTCDPNDVLAHNLAAISVKETLTVNNDTDKKGETTPIKQTCKSDMEMNKKCETSLMGETSAISEDDANMQSIEVHEETVNHNRDKGEDQEMQFTEAEETSDISIDKDRTKGAVLQDQPLRLGIDTNTICKAKYMKKSSGESMDEHCEAPTVSKTYEANVGEGKASRARSVNEDSELYIEKNKNHETIQTNKTSERSFSECEQYETSHVEETFESNADQDRRGEHIAMIENIALSTDKEEENELANVQETSELHTDMQEKFGNGGASVGISTDTEKGLKHGDAFEQETTEENTDTSRNQTAQLDNSQASKQCKDLSMDQFLAINTESGTIDDTTVLRRSSINNVTEQSREAKPVNETFELNINQDDTFQTITAKETCRENISSDKSFESNKSDKSGQLMAIKPVSFPHSSISNNGSSDNQDRCSIKSGSDKSKEGSKNRTKAEGNAEKMENHSLNSFVETFDTITNTNESSFSAQTGDIEILDDQKASNSTHEFKDETFSITEDFSDDKKNFGKIGYSEEENELPHQLDKIQNTVTGSKRSEKSKDLVNAETNERCSVATLQKTNETDNSESAVPVKVAEKRNEQQPVSNERLMVKGSIKRPSRIRDEFNKKDEEKSEIEKPFDKPDKTKSASEQESGDSLLDVSSISRDESSEGLQKESEVRRQTDKRGLSEKKKNRQGNTCREEPDTKLGQVAQENETAQCSYTKGELIQQRPSNISRQGKTDMADICNFKEKALNVKQESEINIIKDQKGTETEQNTRGNAMKAMTSAIPTVSNSSVKTMEFTISGVDSVTEGSDDTPRKLDVSVLNKRSNDISGSISLETTTLSIMSETSKLLSDHPEIIQRLRSPAKPVEAISPSEHQLYTNKNMPAVKADTKDDIMARLRQPVGQSSQTSRFKMELEQFISNEASKRREISYMAKERSASETTEAVGQPVMSVKPDNEDNSRPGEFFENVPPSASNFLANDKNLKHASNLLQSITTISNDERQFSDRKATNEIDNRVLEINTSLKSNICSQEKKDLQVSHTTNEESKAEQQNDNNNSRNSGFMSSLQDINGLPKSNDNTKDFSVSTEATDGELMTSTDKSDLINHQDFASQDLSKICQDMSESKLARNDTTEVSASISNKNKNKSSELSNDVKNRVRAAQSSEMSEDGLVAEDTLMKKDDLRNQEKNYPTSIDLQKEYSRSSESNSSANTSITHKKDVKYPDSHSRPFSPTSEEFLTSQSDKVSGETISKNILEIKATSGQNSVKKSKKQNKNKVDVAGYQKGVQEAAIIASSEFVTHSYCSTSDDSNVSQNTVCSVKQSAMSSENNSHCRTCKTTISLTNKVGEDTSDITETMNTCEVYGKPTTNKVRENTSNTTETTSTYEVYGKPMTNKVGEDTSDITETASTYEIYRKLTQKFASKKETEFRKGYGRTFKIKNRTDRKRNTQENSKNEGQGVRRLNNNDSDSTETVLCDSTSGGQLNRCVDNPKIRSKERELYGTNKAANIKPEKTKGHAASFRQAKRRTAKIQTMDNTSEHKTILSDWLKKEDDAPSWESVKNQSAAYEYELRRNQRQTSRSCIDASADEVAVEPQDVTAECYNCKRARPSTIATKTNERPGQIIDGDTKLAPRRTNKEPFCNDNRTRTVSRKDGVVRPRCGSQEINQQPQSNRWKLNPHAEYPQGKTDTVDGANMVMACMDQRSPDKQQSDIGRTSHSLLVFKDLEGKTVQLKLGELAEPLVMNYNRTVGIENHHVVSHPPVNIHSHSQSSYGLPSSISICQKTRKGNGSASHVAEGKTLQHPTSSFNDDYLKLLKERDGYRSEINELRNKLNVAETRQNDLCQAIQAEYATLKGIMPQQSALKVESERLIKVLEQRKALSREYEEVIGLMQKDLDDPGKNKRMREKKQKLITRVQNLETMVEKEEARKENLERATDKLLRFTEHTASVLSNGSHNFSELAEKARSLTKVTRMLLSDESRLPYGLEKGFTEDGHGFYIDHLSERTSWSETL